MSLWEYLYFGIEKDDYCRDLVCYNIIISFMTFYSWKFTGPQHRNWPSIMKIRQNWKLYYFWHKIKQILVFMWKWYIFCKSSNMMFIAKQCFKYLFIFQRFHVNTKLLSHQSHVDTHPLLLIQWSLQLLVLTDQTDTTLLNHYGSVPCPVKC